ncbi:chromate transporter [Pullulanibacillus sp. KACC 23026]|uniref:chromate transporter n=1 Tax=Pullulanibacillus sp. KACC 23026 TaxID=3028315 RepID=UPI0023B0A694|nr:chromate transporter [Pullulanibacillus sp. KACC 23026]WEG14876.1 chromate transporter [Pullulanibacillus sp. KACC 23026]
MKLWQLWIAFFRAGLLGYGGGPSAIPLVHKEVVDRYKWMTDDDFGDVLALANALPGPIATKLAGYVGWREAGFLGMLVSLLATCLPTILLMIILLVFLSSFQNQAWVKGMTRAVVPIVAVMLGTMTWQFFSKSQKEMGWVKAILLTAACFVALQIFGIHPAIIIAILLLAALLIPSKKEEVKMESEKGVS